MNDRFQAVDCPSCGAPIQVPEGGKRFFICKFCGTTLEDQTTSRERETGQFPKVIIYSQPPGDQPANRSQPVTIPKNLSRWGGLILFLVIAAFAVSVMIPLVLSGVFTIGGLALADRFNTVKIYSFGLARMVNSDQDSQPDIVAITRNSDETLRMVYVDFEVEPHLRWQSEPLGEGADYVYNPIVANPSLVFMAYKTNLTAFDRVDGSLAWQAALSDEITNICEDCLQIFGERIVALTADGVLTGFNLADGETAWSIRLNETPRQLLHLAGRVAVLDEEDGQVGINVYDPNQGELNRRIVPQCPNDIFPDNPQTLGIYDPLFVSSNHQNLFIPIIEWEPGCLQKWDAASLTQTYQATIPGDVLDAIHWHPYLFTDMLFVFSDGNHLHRINLSDGRYSLIFGDEDKSLVPLAVQDDILIVQATRTRGTAQHSLLGIDPSDSDQFWQFDPIAKNVYEGSSDVVHKEGVWSVRVGPGEIILFESFVEPGHINFTLLDPSDGTVVDSNTLTVLKADHSYWISILGWKKSQVFMVADAKLWWIEADSATEIASWP